MPKRIGQLRHCVTLLKQVNQPLDNPSGEDEEFYQTITERYAAVDPISAGAQYLTERNLQDKNTHKVWIRYDDTLLDRGIIDHLIHKGRLFEIQNVVVDREEIRFLILECRELGDATDPKYDIRP